MNTVKRLALLVIIGTSALYSQVVNPPFNGGGGGGTAVAPYSTTFSSQTSVSISAATHGQGTLAVAQCFDASTPRVAVACSYTRNSSGDLVFTFSPAQSGQIEVGSGGGSVSGSGNPAGAVGTIQLAGAANTFAGSSFSGTPYVNSGIMALAPTGIDPTGVSNSTAGINAALAASLYLRLPCGTYTITPGSLVIPYGATIEGSGSQPDGTICTNFVSAGAGIAFNILQDIGSVTLRDFSVTCSSVAGSTGFVIGGTDPTKWAVKILLDNIDVNYCGRNALVQSAWGINFHNFVSHNAITDYGLYIHPPALGYTTNILVDGQSLIYSNANSGIFADGNNLEIAINESIIERNGAIDALLTGTGRTVSVENTYFENTTYMGLSITTVLAQSNKVLLTGNTFNGDIAQTMPAVATVSTGNYGLFDTSFQLTQITAPETIMTVAVNAVAGNLTGPYRYRVTCYNSVGETEYAVQAVTATVSPSSQKVDISGIPTCQGAIGRRLYRALPAATVDSPYLSKLVVQIADNTTTVYTDNIADGSLGVFAPGYNTTQTRNTLNGENFLRVDGSTNGSIALGVRAGGASSTGSGNSIFGYEAGKALTTGFFNDMHGYMAGTATTTGYQNVFSGVKSGFANTTGFSNTCYGQDSCNQGTTQNNSTAIGYFAGYWNNGSGNVWVGSTAGAGASTVKTGNSNVGVGVAALGTGIGNFNIGIGYGAGQINTGASNTFIGYNAANSNTSGTENVVIGVNAFANQTTGGNGNVGIGFDVGFNNTGQYNICIGYWSCFYQTTESNVLMIGNADYSNKATALTNSILYGIMAATPAGQTLSINATLKVSGLKTTGAATGKTVVCVDVATGQLYASTSGVACAN